ncbi:hypothetical protein PUN28_015027 [Cardiocondyla obscurior]|uniref:Uncharacterized protein n=1 Tax=Cardiocondyla obscurior TaxID=286306 RepID=A0AAW2EYC6_9HYME
MNGRVTVTFYVNIIPQFCNIFIFPMKRKSFFNRCDNLFEIPVILMADDNLETDDSFDDEKTLKNKFQRVQAKFHESKNRRAALRREIHKPQKVLFVFLLPDKLNVEKITGFYRRN